MTASHAGPVGSHGDAGSEGDSAVSAYTESPSPKKEAVSVRHDSAVMGDGIVSGGPRSGGRAGERGGAAAAAAAAAE